MYTQLNHRPAKVIRVQRLSGGKVEARWFREISSSVSEFAKASYEADRAGDLYFEAEVAL